MPQTYPADLEALTGQLTTAYERAWATVVNEQERVARGIVQNPRLWRQRDRLAEVRQRIELEMAHVDAMAHSWVSREYPRYYEAGGQHAAEDLASPFSWTQTHREAVALLSQDAMEDLLEATQHVRDDTKRFLRRAVSREVVNDQLVGKTAKQTAANVAKFLQSQGITSVVYANGARVGLDTYAEMAIRTKTAVAYNVGTLNQGAEFGVKFYEVFDGPECGWFSHNDLELANGKIVDASEATTAIIAHPRCARSFGARPDLTKKEGARPTPGGQELDRAEAAAHPLEASARTPEARDAAKARREAAGLQNRPRTPQRVLERRALMLQDVKVLKASSLADLVPQPPQMGERLKPAPEKAPKVAKWRQDFDAAVRELDPISIPTATRVREGDTQLRDLMRPDATPSKLMLEREKAVQKAGKAIDDEATKRATRAVKKGGLDHPEKIKRAADEARDAMSAAQEAHYQLDRLIRNELLERNPAYIDMEFDARRRLITSDPRWIASDATIDRLQAEALRLGQLKVKAEEAYALAFRDAVREVLGEIRPMGGIGGIAWTFDTQATIINMEGTAALRMTPAQVRDVIENLNAAGDFFPRDWSVASNMKGDLRPGTAPRGFQRDLGGGDSDVVLSPSKSGWLKGDDPAMLRVATHELGHRMEAVDERIRSMEWTFHQRRTSVMDRAGGFLKNQERAVNLGGSMDGEMAMPDKFRSVYMGKVYGGGPASFYELLSMGMEGVFTGTNELTWLDADYRRFILGLLGSL